MPGKVYITGVGPGDWKLMTLKAAECIGKADVVVYDRLVGSRILKLARPEAELVYVGKRPDFHAVPQDMINAILVDKALEGKTIARVKGGDPFVFGRGGEEAEALRENGIEFEIIPGITSAIAVPAYAGIPVTHRDFCSSVHIITGHEMPGKDKSSIDYDHLAKMEGTLVFLMGVKNLGGICENLIRCGKAPDTPAAVIERGTTPQQKKVIGTLENIVEMCAKTGVKSPAVAVIGSVVELHEKLGWFPKGKLAGKKIVVTRSMEQASKLADMIQELGGEALEYPVIKFIPPESFEPLDKALNELNTFKWLIFTSVNGVKAFFDRMRFNDIDIRRLAGVSLCAVGEATGAELGKLGLNVECMPDKFTTEELLKELLPVVKPKERILLARADMAAPELSAGLAEKGCEVHDIAAYRTDVDDTGRAELIELIDNGSVDFITFTSSSTVKNFMMLIGEENAGKLDKIKTVCIGPVTAKTAAEYGIKVSAEADVHTINGLVEKLLELV